MLQQRFRMQIIFYCFLLFFSVVAAVGSDRADLILFGGDILTVNEANPTVEAVAVRNGKILSVGKKQEVMKWKGDQTELVDLNGSVLLPGFIAFKPLSAEMEDLKAYAKNGFTTVTDLQMKGDIEPLSEAAHQKNCPVRMQGYVTSDKIAEIPDLQKGNDELFKVLGVRIGGDKSAIQPLVLQARKSNLQVVFCACGDEEVKTALTLAENTFQQYPKGDHRYLLENVSLEDQKLIEQMYAVKASPCFTNAHTYYWETACKERLKCEPLANQIDRAGLAKRAGGKFSFSDDAPPSVNHPLLMLEIASIQETLGRSLSNLDERLTVEDTIKALTLHAAWQTFREKELGSIEVGKKADFVLLSQNPKKLDPHQIKNIQVLGTWINGKKVVL